jgi:ABC-type lipoprotein export system ATPase subunit
LKIATFPNAGLVGTPFFKNGIPMASSVDWLKVQNVYKAFVTGAGTLPILSNINLDLQRGESAAIVGPSGSGKSTLLNIIGTLENPTRGSVLLDGKDLAKLDEKESAAVRNREIGFIFQAHHLLPHCTVLENVLVPTIVFPAGDLKSSAPERASALLKKIGLGHRLDHRPGQLSGGEQQRVAVVRALINQPKVVLADEPTGALDRKSAESLSEVFAELNRENQFTLLMVTHSLEMARRMQKIYELRDGELFLNS